MIARWERRHREAVIAERSRRLLGRLVLELGLEFLLAPPRAPGGPLARRRRQRAHEALQQLEQRELRERLGKR